MEERIKCIRCGENKSINNFYRRESVRGYRQPCKDCIKIERKFRRRKQKLNSYGISQEIYEEMIKIQNNRCSICKKMFNGDICIDHNHETGKVRGLLCINCNSGLGFFKENENILELAKHYLEVNN